MKIEVSEERKKIVGEEVLGIIVYPDVDYKITLNLTGEELKQFILMIDSCKVPSCQTLVGGIFKCLYARILNNF